MNKKRESESQETILLRNKIVNMASALPAYDAKPSEPLQLKNKKPNQYRVDPNVFNRFRTKHEKGQTKPAEKYTKTPNIQYPNVKKMISNRKMSMKRDSTGT